LISFIMFNKQIITIYIKTVKLAFLTSIDYKYSKEFQKHKITNNLTLFNNSIGHSCSTQLQESRSDIWLSVFIRNQGEIFRKNGNNNILERELVVFTKINQNIFLKIIGGYYCKNKNWITNSSIYLNNFSIKKYWGVILFISKTNYRLVFILKLFFRVLHSPQQQKMLSLKIDILVNE